MCVCKSFTTNMVVVIFTFGRLHLSSIVRKRTFREWNKSKTELHHVHCTVHRIQCLVVFQFICCFFFVVVQYADSVIEHNVSRKQRKKSYIETERKKKQNQPTANYSNEMEQPILSTSQNSIESELFV